MGKGVASQKHVEENNSIPAVPAGMPDVEFSENAFELFRRRYMRKGENGETIESKEETFWRVAYSIALEEQ